MIVDLLILTVIGCVLEALATMMSGMVFNAAPTFTFSLLIIFICVARWNLWGLLPIPILAIATWIGGSMNSLENLAATYDWRIYLSVIIGMLAVGVNVIFFKKFGTKRTLHSNLKMVGLICLDYVLYNIIQFIVYRLICSGTLSHSGYIPVEYMTYPTDASPVQMIANVCTYGESGFVFNLLGLSIAFIGLFVLRSQGVVCNVVEKLVCDKKEAEAIRIETEQFESKRDEEASQKELEQDSSEKKY